MQILSELGNNLKIVRVDINKELKEQDLNAQIMSKAAFSQLVENVKKRGGLESLPYCVLKDGKIEIVSGHHRVRACRAAGIVEIPILLDESNLTRSQIIAKQLAHNSIVGTSDKDILKQLYEEMDNIDDKLESFINVDDLAKSGLSDADVVNLTEEVKFKDDDLLIHAKGIRRRERHSGASGARSARCRKGMCGRGFLPAREENTRDEEGERREECVCGHALARHPRKEVECGYGKTMA